MTKKLIVFILILSLSLSSVVYASDSVIFDVLNINGVSDDNETITRSEYISMVAKIMNLDTNSAIQISPYKDIDENHAYIADVNALSDLGIINGDSNGNVYPDEPVTWNQAIKIILSAMGYSVLCEASGGYPAGYVSVANRINLTENIGYEGDSNLSYDNAIALLWNAVDINIYEQSGYGTNQKYEVSDETLLSRYHNIYMVRDVVVGTGFKNSDIYSDVDKGFVKIGDNIYRDNGIDFNNLVGHNVRFYYKKDESKHHLAVAVFDDEDDNQITTISIDNIYDIRENVIYYYDEKDKPKTLSVSADANIVYNNAPAEKFVKSDFSNSYGSVTYVERAGESELSTLIIECWTDFVVSAVDINSGLIFDIYSDNVLDISDDRDVVFVDEYGNRMEIVEMAQYDVISALVSKDSSKVEAYYSNTEIRGTIEEISTLNDTYTLKINGTNFETSKLFFDNNSLKIGDSGIFVLNNKKKIASYKRIDGDTVLWGYLIDASVPSTSLDSKYCYKILTQYGDVEVYEASDKIYFDSETVKTTSSSVYQQLSENGSGVQPEVIRYKTNKNNEITYIDTPSVNPGGDNELNEFYSSSTELIYRNSTAMFGTKIPVSGSTIAFCVPANLSDAHDDEYRAYKATKYFDDDKYYAIKAYKTEQKSHFADVVVYNSDGAPSTNYASPMMIVDNVSLVTDEDGEAVNKISGYLNSGVREIITKTEDVALVKDKTGKHRRLATGDVVRYVTDVDGKVILIDLLYDAVRDEMVGNNPSHSSSNAQGRIILGKVYSQDRGNIYITTSDDLAEGLTLDELESYNASSYTIYVYDKQKREPIYSGSVNDITSYIDTGNPSKVFIHSYYSLPRLMYVIK